MKKVTILMSTYNGEKYLDEQLQSLIGQVGVIISILVRDDGSTDGTINILDKWQNLGNLTYYKGENIGPGPSFIDLIKNAPLSEYYAFCDQDDFWLPEKLYAAIRKLVICNDLPSFYFSNTILVDEKLKKIGISRIMPKLTLQSALMNNVATGCTIVFNRRLLENAQSSLPDKPYMHDAWLYRFCLALKGKVIFDNNTFILYRQHSNNVIGGRISFFKKWKSRFSRAFIQNKRIRTTSAACMLQEHGNILPDESLKIILEFSNCQNSLRNKLQIIRNKEFRSNSKETNLLFIIALMMGRL